MLTVLNKKLDLNLYLQEGSFKSYLLFLFIYVKKEIKCNNIINKIQKLINFDYIIKNIKEQNPNWPKIPDHAYRILITGRSGSGHQSNTAGDIDKFYLYAKHPYEAKYQLLISKRKGVGLKESNGSKAFIQYFNNMDDIYENSEEYKPDKKCN